MLLKDLFYFLSFAALSLPCSAATFVANPNNMAEISVHSGTRINGSMQTVTGEFEQTLSPGESTQIVMRALLEELQDMSSNNSVEFIVYGLDKKITDPMRRSSRCISKDIDKHTDIKSLDAKTYTISILMNPKGQPYVTCTSN